MLESLATKEKTAFEVRYIEDRLYTRDTYVSCMSVSDCMNISMSECLCVCMSERLYE